MADTRQNSASVKFRDILIIAIDVIVVLSRFFYYAVEGIYLMIKGGVERDVSQDIVLVTGAGHGIGKETALKYGTLGATVVCWDLNEKSNLETVAEIKSAQGKAFGYTVDVTSREKVLEASKKVQETVGNVTILVNNAGIMPQHELLKHSEPEIRKMFDVNVMAHFWTLDAFLPSMLKNNCGHIVALSSMAGLCGLQNLVPYCGTKFAVRGIMEALREELRLGVNDSKIKFTTIYPYMVDTGLCKKVKIRFENLMKLVDPKDVANAIVSAQRRGLEEIAVPRYLFYLNSFLRVFPTKGTDIVRDFFNSGVESDM